MLWLSAIKRYLFSRSLRQEAAQLKRQGELKNFANSRYIGIWFDGSDRNNFALIDTFAHKLASKGKKVELLGYAGKVKKSEDIPFEYLEPKEINWAGIPQKGTTKAWAEKPYDLLLCLHTQECRPLEYMAMLSKAKCRVGRYEASTVEYYDLMVSLSDEKSLAQMIKQVDQLLTEINKNQQQNAATV